MFLNKQQEDRAKKIIDNIVQRYFGLPVTKDTLYRLTSELEATYRNWYRGGWISKMPDKEWLLREAAGMCPQLRIFL